MLKDLSPGQTAAALNYLLHFDSIGGWLEIDTAFAMMELAWEQARLGLDPGMAEIGVHYGKSFLALVCGAMPGEELIAIDVFERQDLNIDKSGEGNTEYFLATLARFFPGVKPRLIAASSETLRGAEAAHGLQNLRFFSVDGGHTTALTLNDLEVADAALAPGGICALDDVFNTHWTGVVSGLFRYFEAGGGLVPFAMVPNKLLLCRPAWYERYRGFMRTRFAYALDKPDLEFGPRQIDNYWSIWQPALGHLGALADLVFAGEREALRGELAGVRDRLAMTEADFAGARDRLAAREAELAGVRGRLAMTEAELAGARDRLAGNEAELAGARARLADCEAGRAALAAEAAAQAAARAAAERDAAALRASTSWRVTAPMRAVSRLVAGRR